MIAKFKDYFQDKKVLITGHTGFKGTWLTNWLLNLESKIIGFSKKIPTNPSMFDVLGLNNYMTHIEGDIRNFKTFNNIIQENNPDIIIHLAAQPLIRRSYLKPVETYETNVMGTVNLFESLKNLKGINNSINNSNKFVLNITTDKCYENKEQNYAYKETDPLGGYDPYSSSKACSEIITSAYTRSFFNDSEISIATARAGNIIGGGDWSEDRLVVDCIKSLSSNNSIVIRNPKAIRPWQHVLEGISGYLTLICQMIENNNVNNENISWNFGPYRENIVDVKHLVKEIIANWGYGEYVVEKDQKFHEANLLELDITKSLSNLDWKPKLNFEESITMTVEWYKEFYSNDSDMLDFTNKQIKNYIKK